MATHVTKNCGWASRHARRPRHLAGTCVVSLMIGLHVVHGESMAAGAGAAGAAAAADYSRLHTAEQ